MVTIAQIGQVCGAVQLLWPAQAHMRCVLSCSHSSRRPAFWPCRLPMTDLGNLNCHQKGMTSMPLGHVGRGPWGMFTLRSERSSRNLHGGW